MKTEEFVLMMNTACYTAAKEQEFVCSEVGGFSAPKLMRVLNLAVQCLEEDEIYLEVGTNQGRTLIGALVDTPCARAISVDNFSQFNENGKAKDILLDNIWKHHIENIVLVFDQGCTEFFREVMPKLNKVGVASDFGGVDFVPMGKIGVYFYDGNHDTEIGYNALVDATPFLADKAIILVDDFSGPGVWESVRLFLNKYPKTKILFAMSTNNFPFPNNSWWNGIIALEWNGEDKSDQWAEQDAYLLTKVEV